MTRIIAGFAGSLPLTVPSSGTRPTSDRVREAIFSALEARDAIRGARVLDLFAGSGALGLEAASRGAAAVTLVERSRPAAALCRKNADRLLRAASGISAPTITVSATSAESHVSTAVGPWDLVFLDPPYDYANEPLVALLDGLAEQLSADAVVIVERAAREPEPAWPAALEPGRRRDYGDTVVYSLSPMSVGHPEPAAGT